MVTGRTRNSSAKEVGGAAVYVIVHGLTILIHENHGWQFWVTMGRVMPDYEEWKRRLREPGSRLVW